VVSVTDPYGRILGILDRQRWQRWELNPDLWICSQEL
jgi:hypothetical protein